MTTAKSQTFLDLMIDEDFVNFKCFLRKKGRKLFVLNIDFIIALKRDALCVYERTKGTIKQDSI